MGINKNQLTEFVEVATGNRVEQPEEDKELLEVGTKENPYNIEVFEKLGQDVCTGILDYFELNLKSRIPTTKYKDLKGVKQEMFEIIEAERQKREANSNNTYNRLYNGGNRKTTASYKNTSKMRSSYFTPINNENSTSSYSRPMLLRPRTKKIIFTG